MSSNNSSAIILCINIDDTDVAAIVFQAQCLRESITRLADGTKTFAQRVSTISEAEKEIASSIPVVPTQIGRINKEYQG
jgi:hypothetical protein